MSQQNMNQGMPIPNGLPTNYPSMVPPQKNFNSHVNNGLGGSSHSSRDSSPGARVASQLPPARGNIPSSQLPPPVRPGVSPIPYNLGLNSSNGPSSASVSHSSDLTPHSSPKLQNFSTSTPNAPPLSSKSNDNSVNNVQQNMDINTVNKSTNYTPVSYTTPQLNPNLVKQQIPQNVTPMRTNQQTGQNLTPTSGQPQQSMIHSSSTPTLQNLAQPGRQDLNQPQTVPRPLSSGPQLQQNVSQVEQMTGPVQFGKTGTGNINQQSYNYSAAPLLQRPQATSGDNRIATNYPSQIQPTNIQPVNLQPQHPQVPNPMQPNLQPLNQQPSIPMQPNLQPLNQQPSNPMQPNLQPQNQQPPNLIQPINQQPPNLIQPINQQPPNLIQPINQQPPNLIQPINQQPPNLIQPINQQPQNTMQPLNQQPNQIRPLIQLPNQPQPSNQVLPPIQSQAPSNPQIMATNYGAPTASIAPPPTSVSNLHSKRYPPNPTSTQNTYGPNINLSQQNSNLPTAINNYNQQQTMYQQGNIYQQPQSHQIQQQQSTTNAYNQPANLYNQPVNTYNQQQQQYATQLNQQRNYQQINQQMQNMNIVKSGYNKLWGNENYDLLQCPNVLPEEAIDAPRVSLGQEFLDSANCSYEIFRCTMTKIPENNSLLQKSRLPLGVLIHPFKDLNHLPVIQCNTIVRCRACRTYINPFIFFVDTKRWKCNLCYRVNELPEEFQYDPVSKSYGDPSRRPEIKSSTIEYIAPSEYMLRPPQPAVYLFLLDISRLAVESGYLHTICDALSSQLATLPGDARTQIGFIAYNTTLHFFSLAEGLNQPHEMIVTDVDDVFLPCPDNLLVNLKEHMDLLTDLLVQLPTRYQNSFDSGSALGAALQAAFKMMSSTGGRVTVFQVSLPMVGPGALTVREDPNQRAGKEAPHLNPATDFYKRLALDCSGHQIAVDLFILNSQYVDIATLSGISRFSGGCMHHFPLFKASKTIQADNLDRCFKRYLNRKIGFEAVMRIRCTRGLSIHTFHGNFFVRSTDLLSLPNVNPDAGFGMQVSIEESLADLQSVCFQAALLYTSSKGERRIRVHTLCLPVVNSLSDILNSADQQCIVGILSKMAVDRSLQSSLSDARDAFINVAIDILSSYKLSLNMGNSSNGLLAPQSLKLLPLYILALLKYTAFRTGHSTRLDDRVFAMCEMKSLPLAQLIQQVYPDLYPVYRLAECSSVVDAEGSVIPQPRRLQLTARNIDSHGAYILDVGQQMFLYVCPNVSQQFLVHALGVPNYNSIPDPCYELQIIDNPDNQRLHAFINSLNDEKPYPAPLQIIRDNSTSRSLLLERLVEDRIESALSYNEFLQHIKTQVK